MSNLVAIVMIVVPDRPGALRMCRLFCDRAEPEMPTWSTPFPVAGGSPIRSLSRWRLGYFVLASDMSTMRLTGLNSELYFRETARGKRRRLDKGSNLPAIEIVPGRDDKTQYSLARKPVVKAVDRSHLIHRAPRP